MLIEYSNIQGGAPGVTNIDANPQFVSSTYFALQSTSPCIDVGTIQSGLVEDWGDVDDDGDRSEQLPLDFRVRTLTMPPADYLRLVNTRTDMGAFEFDN